MPTMGFTLHHTAKSPHVKRLVYVVKNAAGEVESHGDANQSRVVDVLHGYSVEIKIALQDEKGEPL